MAFNFRYTTYRNGKIVEQNKLHVVNGKPVKLNTRTEATLTIASWNRQGRGEWEYNIDSIDPVSTGKCALTS
jgi:hypothetical protein